MPFFRVGEKVPEVMSHSGTSWVRVTLMPGRGNARPVATRPRRRRAGPASLTADQRLAPPELVLLPADGPAEAGLDRGDVEGDVLAVQRVAHLGAQRVAGAEPAREHRRTPRPQPAARPTAAGDLVGGDQLVAALAGVAGAAHHDRDLRAEHVGDLGLDERHVVVTGRQADALQHLVGLRDPARRARRSRRGGSVTETPSGASACRRRTTSAVLAALGTSSTCSSSW